MVEIRIRNCFGDIFASQRKNGDKTKTLKRIDK